MSSLISLFTLEAGVVNGILLKSYVPCYVEPQCFEPFHSRDNSFSLD